MAKVKHYRSGKRQLGQFFTPDTLARRIVSECTIDSRTRVLEPGFGGGAFLLPLIEAFMGLRNGDLEAVLTENVWGVEIDSILHSTVLREIEERWGHLPARHNLFQGDFLDPAILVECVAHDGLFSQENGFDLIVGNPPFGGTVPLHLQDVLDRQFGERHGHRIKRETYSLFIIKSLDLLKSTGVITFICSDTFLTIPTMKGLRNALMLNGETTIRRLNNFSEETDYPMVIVSHRKKSEKSSVNVDGEILPLEDIRMTGNFSWHSLGAFAPLFRGPCLSEFVVASSGMTTGKNDYFVRELDTDGWFDEPLDFIFFSDPILLSREVARARLNKVSERRIAEIKLLEASGATRRNVRVIRRDKPLRLRMPHPDYRYYNKAQGGLVYVSPRFVIFWKDDGDAVKTFKKNGNWYLHGVGGMPFFEREGLTWRLISSTLDMRYLPSGYILDSGAPCAFLKDSINRDELWFILGWCISNLATRVLKSVLNHTMNIQSKDVERLPYPWWTSAADKEIAIRMTRDAVFNSMNGIAITKDNLQRISSLYKFQDLS